MDNKQKRKMYKLIYKTLMLFICLISAFGIYYNAILITDGMNIIGPVTVIVLNCLVILLSFADSVYTVKLKNKFNFGKIVYLIVLVAALVYVIIYGICSVSNSIVERNILAILLSLVYPTRILLISCALLAINFIIGIKVSKLLQSTTITIDSVAETPNYDDELMLKKKLNELNRKLEIKKVQEQIDKIEKELDNK